MKLEAQYLETVKEAAQIARDEGFLHVASLLQRIGSQDRAELSDLDTDQLRTFARYVRARASLLHPYWDHSRRPYVEADEEEFLELMNGFYGSFASFLLDELGLAVELERSDAESGKASS
jgi:hypothetical protein